MVYVSSAKKHLWKAWNITHVNPGDGLPNPLTTETRSRNGIWEQQQRTESIFYMSRPSLLKRHDSKTIWYGSVRGRMISAFIGPPNVKKIQVTYKLSVVETRSSSCSLDS